MITTNVTGSWSSSLGVTSDHAAGEVLAYQHDPTAGGTTPSTITFKRAPLNAESEVEAKDLPKMSKNLSGLASVFPTFWSSDDVFEVLESPQADAVTHETWRRQLRSIFKSVLAERENFTEKVYSVHLPEGAPPNAIVVLNAFAASAAALQLKRALLRPRGPSNGGVVQIGFGGEYASPEMATKALARAWACTTRGKNNCHLPLRLSPYPFQLKGGTWPFDKVFNKYERCEGCTYDFDVIVKIGRCAGPHFQSECPPRILRRGRAFGLEVWGISKIMTAAVAPSLRSLQHRLLGR